MKNKIIIIDDSEIVLNELINLLEPKGYQLIKALDGRAGMQVIKNNLDGALILLDYHMPNYNGLDMIEKLQEENVPLPPVVMLTTEAREHHMTRSNKLGILAWIIKPLKPELISNLIPEMVNNLVAESRNSNES